MFQQQTEIKNFHLQIFKKKLNFRQTGNRKLQIANPVNLQDTPQLLSGRF